MSLSPVSHAASDLRTSMKDTSRPSPSRPVPYRKRRASSPVSPIRDVCRPPDADQHQGQPISPRAQVRTHGPHRFDCYSRPDDEHRVSRNGAIHNVPRARRYTNTDDLVHERPSHTRTLSIHADVPGLPLRLPLTPASAPASQRKAETSPAGSVTTFLRSIELPDKHPSVPPSQPPHPLDPPSLHLPSLSTDSTKKAACTNGNDYQVNLVYKGYPFTYDLSALPDDPKGTIALLTTTKSDPGAYIMIGAHYRRTGRSRAACAVIRSLLDSLGRPPGIDKGEGDVTLPSPSAPYHKPVHRTMSVFKTAAMRPALLLLAACEMDISRERPDHPESDDHASTAHELFRTVYGTLNKTIVPEAVRPKSNNSLGLEFSSNGNCASISSSELASLARIKGLEKDLGAARSAQKRLQERLTVSCDRLARAEDKVRVLESRSREVLVQLDASRDENWDLRQRLAESERRARELVQVQCSPNTESRVWGKIKDLLFDNLGGGMRGE